MLSMIAALAAACSPPKAHEFPKTALFEGLTKLASYEAGQQLLDERVKQRYRVGAPEGNIETFLRSQGMQVSRKTGVGQDGKSVYGLAKAFDGIGICDKVVSVEWRASTVGTITELNVVYSDTGCL